MPNKPWQSRGSASGNAGLPTGSWAKDGQAEMNGLGLSTTEEGSWGGRRQRPGAGRPNRRKRRRELEALLYFLYKHIQNICF